MKYQPKTKAAPPTEQELRECREHFEQMPKVRQLTAKAQRLIHSGHLAEAKKVLDTKAAAFDRMVAYCMEAAEQQHGNLTLKTAGLPDSDRREVQRLLVTLYMAIDIMDSCLMDINDTLHRTNSDLSYEEADDIHKVAQMCKQHLEKFNTANGAYKYDFWGDITDNMYEIMQNKAKAIIRKQEEQENLKQKK